MNEQQTQFKDNRGSLGFSQTPQHCCFEGCEEPAFFYRIEGVTIIPNDKKAFSISKTFKQPYCNIHLKQLPQFQKELSQ